MTSSAADLPRRRFEYRIFYQRAQDTAKQAGHDLNDMVERHSGKLGRSHDVANMGARDLRHWREWITRALGKKGVKA